MKFGIPKKLGVPEETRTEGPAESQSSNSMTRPSKIITDVPESSALLTSPIKGRNDGAGCPTLDAEA